MRLMNILIDLRPLQSGKISGVEVFTKNIVKNLIKADREINFFLWTNSHKPVNIPDFSYKNAFLIQTKIPNKILNLALGYLRHPHIDRIVKNQAVKQGLMHKKEHFDAVFLPDLRPAPVSHKTKKYLFLHDLSFIHFPESFSKKTRFWHKIIHYEKEIHEAKKIFTPSVFTQEDLTKTLGVPRWITRVAPEGVSEEFAPYPEAEQYNFLKKYNLPKKFILTLSTLEPRKNIGTLIEAFSMFCRKNPDEDLYLVIAGKKDEKLFAKHNLTQEKNVIFTGFIPENEKPLFFASCLFFAFPSLFEGFGLPILEAMRSQKSVICSNTSSLPGLISDPRCLFNPLNKEEVCDKIETVYFNEKFREIQAERNLKNSLEYTWQKTALKILNEIQQS